MSGHCNTFSTFFTQGGPRAVLCTPPPFTLQVLFPPGVAFTVLSSGAETLKRFPDLLSSHPNAHSHTLPHTHPPTVTVVELAELPLPATASAVLVLPDGAWATVVEFLSPGETQGVSVVCRRLSSVARTALVGLLHSATTQTVRR